MQSLTYNQYQSKQTSEIHINEYMSKTVYTVLIQAIPACVLQNLKR